MVDFIFSPDPNREQRYIAENKITYKWRVLAKKNDTQIVELRKQKSFLENRNDFLSTQNDWLLSLNIILAIVLAVRLLKKYVTVEAPKKEKIAVIVIAFWSFITISNYLKAENYSDRHFVSPVSVLIDFFESLFIGRSLYGYDSSEFMIYAILPWLVYFSYLFLKKK